MVNACAGSHLCLQPCLIFRQICFNTLAYLFQQYTVHTKTIRARYKLLVSACSQVLLFMYIKSLGGVLPGNHHHCLDSSSRLIGIIIPSFITSLHTLINFLLSAVVLQCILIGPTPYICLANSMPCTQTKPLTKFDVRKKRNSRALTLSYGGFIFLTNTFIIPSVVFHAQKSGEC